MVIGPTEMLLRGMLWLKGRLRVGHLVLGLLQRLLRRLGPLHVQGLQHRIHLVVRHIWRSAFNLPNPIYVLEGCRWGLPPRAAKVPGRAARSGRPCQHFQAVEAMPAAVLHCYITIFTI